MTSLSELSLSTVSVSSIATLFKNKVVHDFQLYEQWSKEVFKYLQLILPTDLARIVMHYLSEMFFSQYINFTYDNQMVINQLFYRKSWCHEMLALEAKDLGLDFSIQNWLRHTCYVVSNRRKHYMHKLNKHKGPYTKKQLTRIFHCFSRDYMEWSKYNNYLWFQEYYLEILDHGVVKDYLKLYDDPWYQLN